MDDDRVMSFFDEFEAPPQPPMPAPRTREPWEGPSDGVIGGWVPWRLVLARAEKAYAVLRNFEAYPSGLGFDLVTYFQEEPRGPRERGMHMMARPDGPRIGVLFADGRKAATGSNPSTAPAQGPGDPQQPVLRPRGGGGSLGKWQMSFWLWPLPPPGRLTWIGAWPDVGTDEVSVDVDASVLEAAARETEVLWVPDPDRHRGYTSTTMPIRSETAPPEDTEPPEPRGERRGGRDLAG